MNYFLSRFYFLSKLTTSFVLLIFLILLSYLFIQAYLEQGNPNSSHMKIEELSSQIFNLKGVVEQNSTNLNVTKDIIQENIKLTKDLDISLETLNNDEMNDNILLQINKLFEENKKLKNELHNISSIINNLENFQSTSPEIKKSSAFVNNILQLIELKLDNGIDFNKEIEILLDLELNAEFFSNVEKLSIYAKESFSGLDQLKADFDQISASYLKDYYLKKDNNYFIKFVFNLVSIQPNLNKNAKDENILFLSSAKQHLLNKNLNESIKQLNRLNGGTSYFSTWIKQATYYEQVRNLLNKF